MRLNFAVVVGELLDGYTRIPHAVRCFLSGQGCPELVSGKDITLGVRVEISPEKSVLIGRKEPIHAKKCASVRLLSCKRLGISQLAE